MQQGSLSREIIKDIYNLSKRNGEKIDYLMPSFSKIVRINDLIKITYLKIRKLRSLKYNSEDDLKIKKLDQVLLQLEDTLDLQKEKKEHIIDSDIDTIFNKINLNRDSFILSKIDSKDTKKSIFTLNRSIENIIKLKYVQSQLGLCFKVSQSNRILISTQIKEILSQTNLQTINIIKIDIANFYESINFDSQLQNTIEDSVILQNDTKTYILKIINKFKIISKQKIGLPRGIGISSYLAEILLSSLDSEIKNMNGVIYYSRYVDDILIIMNKESIIDTKLLESKIKELDLKINNSKCFTTNNIITNSWNFDYLGYKYININGNFIIDISDKKFKKYLTKINKSFIAYENTKSYGRESAKLLVKRLKFLTSNHKLTKPAKITYSGLYYSNILITTFDSLKKIDAHLSAKVNLISSSRLKNELLEIGFEKSFRNKKFFKYDGKNIISEINKILTIWKHVK